MPSWTPTKQENIGMCSPKRAKSSDLKSGDVLITVKRSVQYVCQISSHAAVMAVSFLPTGATKQCSHVQSVRHNSSSSARISRRMSSSKVRRVPFISTRAGITAVVLPPLKRPKEISAAVFCFDLSKLRGYLF